FILLGIFSIPIFYLFSIGAIGRAAVLVMLGLAIFIPAGIVIGFLHLYGPIFIVLYDSNILTAIGLAFNLIVHKLWESLLLAAFIIGLNIFFLMVVVFSLVLLMLPVGVLGLLLYYAGFDVALGLLILGSIIVSILYVIVWFAGFTVFQNAAWVIAVDQMVKSIKSPEKAMAVPAAEPAG
ncbi:hypothetical protein D4R52_01020, partial [bacterium]